MFSIRRNSPKVFDSNIWLFALTFIVIFCIFQGNSLAFRGKDERTHLFAFSEMVDNLHLPVNVISL